MKKKFVLLTILSIIFNACQEEDPIVTPVNSSSIIGSWETLKIESDGYSGFYTNFPNDRTWTVHIVEEWNANSSNTFLDNLDEDKWEFNGDNTFNNFHAYNGGSLTLSGSGNWEVLNGNTLKLFDNTGYYQDLEIITLSNNYLTVKATVLDTMTVNDTLIFGEENTITYMERN